MQGIAAIVEAWLSQRRVGVVARVVGSEGLGSRPVGDVLVIDANGRTGGSLLAGAVQHEVVTMARRLLDSTERATLVSLDVDSVDAVTAGLTCGGSVEILLQRLDSIPTELWDTLASGRPAALATGLRADASALVVFPGGATVGALGDSGLDTMAQAEAAPMLTHLGAGVFRIAVGPAELVIELWNPAPRLLVVGASELSVALSRMVELMGWTASTVVTAESALAAVRQMSVADVVVVIEHDPFIATPVIAAALRMGIGYVGALGSRRTQEYRRQHLADVGVRSIDIDRLRGPTGLDIGARSPVETAVSIVAEVIASRSDRSGAPLGNTTGRISG